MGCILSAISAVLLLIPFIYIWDVVNALLSSWSNFSQAQNIESYAINAFVFAIAGILLNFVALMCTHLSAFRNEKKHERYYFETFIDFTFRLLSNKTIGDIKKIIDYSTLSTEGFFSSSIT